jgi:hypothetical protein
MTRRLKKRAIAAPVGNSNEFTLSAMRRTILEAIRQAVSATTVISTSTNGIDPKDANAAVVEVIICDIHCGND